ncbi:hypothetical protein EPN52_09600 [bacterium]|nr:MAG: hypothetical protein EPN52_09600 [bacterium]
MAQTIVHDTHATHGLAHHEIETLRPDDLRSARRLMWIWVDTGLAIFALMAILGVTMRAEQAGWISFGPDVFYSILTLHGVGMISAMALATMGGIWYMMRLEGPLDERVAYWAYGFIMAGVAAVILSVFPGKFGAAWTFLYPLPFIGATWAPWATGAFLIGMMLVSVGWSIWCVQLLGCIMQRHGSLRDAMGWDYIFHNRAFTEAGKQPPSAQSFAAMVASIDGLLTGAAGMVIGVALLAHLFNPSMQIDPLWAKNVTYFFGHAIANLTIYMACAWVYVGVPRYAGRSYHTSVPLAVAWWGTLIFVLLAYFHHLYMDFAQAQALQYMGEAFSYMSALPTVVVTIFSCLMLVYRSKMRWTLGSIFIYTGLIGWVVGGIGALLDASIPFNNNLHNTLWVPAHFHTYLLGGVLLFVLGFVFMMLEERTGKSSAPALRWLVGTLVFGGMAAFLLGFYVAGAAGVPRRYAIEPAPGPHVASWATVGAIVMLIGMAVALVEGIRMATRKPQGRLS